MPEEGGATISEINPANRVTAPPMGKREDAGGGDVNNGKQMIQFGLFWKVAHNSRARSWKQSVKKAVLRYELRLLKIYLAQRFRNGPQMELAEGTDYGKPMNGWSVFLGGNHWKAGNTPSPPPESLKTVFGSLRSR